MLDLAWAKKNSIPFEYSRRSDGKWNLWCRMQATWFDHDLLIEIDESGMDHLDYRQWVILDVVEELPQAHAISNIRNRKERKRI